MRTATVTYKAVNGRTVKRKVGLGKYTKTQWQRAYDELQRMKDRHVDRTGRPWPTEAYMDSAE